MSKKAKTLKKYLTVVISKLILLTGLNWSAEAAQSAPSPTPAQSVEQELIRSNIIISEWLDSIAEATDLFLTGKKITKKENETRGRIENSSISNEGEGVANNTSFNIQLRLPNVEEYFQLKFTSYDEQEERDIRKRYLRQTPRKQNYGASVGFFKKVGRVKTVFQPRFQLRDPLKISHMIRFETLVETTKASLNPKLEFFADPDKGTGIFNQMNLHIPLNKKFALTLVNEGEYDDKLNPHFKATNGFSISDVINSKMSLSYNLLFSSNNLPTYHLEAYDVAVVWSQLLYKQILDYQIIPHLNFAKYFEYKGHAGISLNVNLNF